MSIWDQPLPAKILLVGKSGAGKTGSLASLIAAGYNLRIIDTDKGFRPLRSLLTDKIHYPYGKIIAEDGIDVTQAVRCVPVDLTMRIKDITTKVGNMNKIEKVLGPKSADGFNKIIDLISDWKEPDGCKLGPVDTWGPKDVLVLDSFSTLAKMSYYYSQALNGRLGARDEGYNYQRDIGAAQSQLTRLLEMLYDSNIKCNVIVITHITWVDESKGYAANPKPNANDTDKRDTGEIINEPDGLPSAIGRALSPQIGKYFNDQFVVRSIGYGANVKHKISTVPQDGVSAKNSVYLEKEYDVKTGLAEIFAALREDPLPKNFLSRFDQKPTSSTPSKPQLTIGLAAQK